MSIVVYSDELDEFKQYAKNLSHFIVSRYRDQPLLSAFKRNDALAQAFGYSGHSDLVQRSKGIARPGDFESKYHYPVTQWLEQVSYYEIATAYAKHFKSLSAEDIEKAWTQAAPKQTEFEVIDGTPVCQFSPLDHDISNELRTEEELTKWWNVPFIEEDYDGERRSFTVRVLDGGAWDRSTFKAHSKTLDDAVQKARLLKDGNPNYRDFDVVDDGITTITVGLVSTERAAVTEILSKCHREQTFAGNVRNALQEVIVQFEQPGSLDLNYICDLLGATTIDEKFAGTKEPCFPFASVDTGTDNTYIVLEVDDPYFGALLTMSQTPVIPKHQDSLLPMSIEDFNERFTGSHHVVSGCYWVIDKTKTTDDKITLMVTSYSLNGTDYYHA